MEKEGYLQPVVSSNAPKERKEGGGRLAKVLLLEQDDSQRSHGPKGGNVISLDNLDTNCVFTSWATDLASLWGW